MKNEIKKRIAMLQQMEILMDKVEIMKHYASDYNEEEQPIPPKPDNMHYWDYIACVEIEKLLQDLVKKI